MAFIRCPECNGQVSDSAFACPKCGFPMSNFPDRGSIPSRSTAELTQSSYRNRWLIAAGLVAVLYVGGLMTSRAPTSSTRPSSEWSGEMVVPVARALVKNHITGCGQMETLFISNGKYSVRCSRDGVTWKTYTVDTNTNQVY